MDRDRPIAKRSIFVTSSGRTGTLFFARLLGRLIPAARAFHEPDVLPNSLKGLREALKHFDPFHLTLGRMSSASCMRRLSIQRQCGRASRAYAARDVRRMRKRFVESLDGDIYVEASAQTIGLIDVLPTVFPNSRTAVLVRDGRDWVRSISAFFTECFGTRDLVHVLGGGRLTAAMCPRDPWHEAWGGFSRFERKCWWWAASNRYALQCISRSPGAKLWKYEDVFLSPARYARLREIVDFVTTFPDGRRVEYGPLDGALERRVHQSPPEAFPHWREWSDTQAAQFQRICGELMSQLGYGHEPQWQEKCARAAATS